MIYEVDTRNPTHGLGVVALGIGGLRWTPALDGVAHQLHSRQAESDDDEGVAGKAIDEDGGNIFPSKGEPAVAGHGVQI